MKITYLIIFVAFLMLLLWVSNTRADSFQEYFQEEVSYIFAYGKPFPERSAFTCVNNKLIKGWNTVKNYKGITIKCRFKTITRQEYKELSNVTRTF